MQYCGGIDPGAPVQFHQQRREQLIAVRNNIPDAKNSERSNLLTSFDHFERLSLFVRIWVWMVRVRMVYV
jgi:hypothetical protein